MSLDCVENRDGQPIVHEPVPSPNTPQRRSANLVRGSLARVLDNAVTGTNVVKRKVGKRSDPLVAESHRYPEGSTVDNRSRRSRYKASRMAHGATDRVEENVAGRDVPVDRTASRRPRCGHEISKRQN